jgi:hypothetical protein
MTEQAEITAFYELSQAKAQYCRALDARDWALLAELMTADRNSASATAIPSPR